MTRLDVARLQVDRKFIVMACDGVLVALDQHAADERVRLEDLGDRLLAAAAAVSVANQPAVCTAGGPRLVAVAAVVDKVMMLLFPCLKTTRSTTWSTTQQPRQRRIRGSGMLNCWAARLLPARPPAA